MEYRHLPLNSVFLEITWSRHTCFLPSVIIFHSLKAPSFSLSILSCLLLLGCFSLTIHPKCVSWAPAVCQTPPRFRRYKDEQNQHHPPGPDLLQGHCRCVRRGYLCFKDWICSSSFGSNIKSIQEMSRKTMKTLIGFLCFLSEFPYENTSKNELYVYFPPYWCKMKLAIAPLVLFSCPHRTELPVLFVCDFRVHSVLS